MKREVCKFFSGSFAALAYAHAAYAVATSRGIINEPVLFGRRWGVTFMWTEAAVYSAASLALGYAGWVAKPHEAPPPSIPSQPEAQAGPSSAPQLVAR